jgi:hypothetical protein
MDLFSLVVVVVVRDYIFLAELKIYFYQYCIKSHNQDISLARYFVSQGIIYIPLRIGKSQNFMNTGLTSFAFVSLINIMTAATFFK